MNEHAEWPMEAEIKILIDGEWTHYAEIRDVASGEAWIAKREKPEDWKVVAR
jgi:hypothetical protein